MQEREMKKEMIREMRREMPSIRKIGQDRNHLSLLTQKGLFKMLKPYSKIQS